jgi:multidrug resistance efflux pump
MADVVYQLFDTVRSAVGMAYAALGVSQLNAQKIAEIERRLKELEAQVDELQAAYESEKRKARGRAISTGIWQAKAHRLRAELDQVKSQFQR